MPLFLQLPDPPVFAFQEELSARAVFRREADAGVLEVPQPLQQEGVLRLVLRHADGTEEDRSPRRRGFVEGSVEILRSKRPEESVELSLPPPGKAGSWTAKMEVSFEGRQLDAPEVSFTVLAPAAVAVAAMAAADRVVQLVKGGILVEHDLVRHGPGEVELAAATRLDALGPAAAAAFPAEPLPGGDPDPLWVVTQEGAAAVARRYGDDKIASPPIPLGSAQVRWLGRPLLLEDQGSVAFAWATGRAAHIALVDPEGKVSGPFEVPFAGEVRHGTWSGKALIVQVAAPPVPPKGAKVPPRLGSTVDAPKETPLESLWSVPLPSRKPELIGIVPQPTVALRGCEGSVWGVERKEKKISAWRLDLFARKAEAHPIAGGREFPAPPDALACLGKGALQLAFIEDSAILVTGTDGESFARPVRRRPLFALFAGRRLVAWDAVRGLYLP